jgi:hypothetical protein
MNDWDNVIPQERADRMIASQIDAHLRKLGHYSHVISFTNADGLPRFIKCHERHVDEHLASLRSYGDRCSNIVVQAL